eukprot:4339192-Amphidinium_carterae.1
MVDLRVLWTCFTIAKEQSTDVIKGSRHYCTRRMSEMKLRKEQLGRTESIKKRQTTVRMTKKT